MEQNYLDFTGEDTPHVENITVYIGMSLFSLLGSFDLKFKLKHILVQLKLYTLKFIRYTYSLLPVPTF